MKTKLIIFSLITLLLLLPCFASGAAAEELAPAETVGAQAPVNETAEDKTQGGEEAERATEDAASQASPAITDALISFLDDNGDTLLSALGVAVSLLLALLYKSGLLPLVSRGLKAISESSDKAAGVTSAFAERAADTLDKLEATTSSALSRAEETALLVKGTEEALAALQEALAEAKAERGRISMVLAEETALFYELLNSVKLPEAQKDVIRERYYGYQALLEHYDKSHETLTREGEAE